MSVLSRIFRGEHRELGAPESYIEQTSEDGQVRLRRVPDTSMNAIAARWNAGMIYGAQNVPANFGTRSVIEVQDRNNPGRWVPVTGSHRGIPGMDAQMAALQSYRETGVIGPQPVNDGGSMSLGAGGGGQYGDYTGSGTVPLIENGAGTLPIEEAQVQGGSTRSPFTQLLETAQSGLEAVFPSGTFNAMELSEFILENPSVVGAETEAGAAFILDEIQQGAQSSQQTQAPAATQQTAPSQPLSAGAQDFLASEDAVIAQEQAAASSGDQVPGESESARSLRIIRERVDRMLRENGLRTN